MAAVAAASPCSCWPREGGSAIAALTAAGPLASSTATCLITNRVLLALLFCQPRDVTASPSPSSPSPSTQLLKLQAENDDLKAQELEDRRRIQHLLALTQPVGHETTFFRGGAVGGSASAAGRPLRGPPVTWPSAAAVAAAAASEGGAGLAPGAVPATYPAGAGVPHIAAGTPLGRAGFGVASEAGEGSAPTASAQESGTPTASSSPSSPGAIPVLTSAFSTKAPPEVRVVELEATVAALRKQLEAERRLLADKSAALARDRTAMRDTYERRATSDAAQIAALSAALKTAQEKLAATTKDYLFTRYHAAQAETARAEEVATLRAAHAAAQRDLDAVTSAGREAVTVLRSKADTASRETEVLRDKAARDRAEDARVLRARHASEVAALKQRIVDLETELESTKRRAADASLTFAREKEGFATDVGTLRRSVRALEAQWAAVSSVIDRAAMDQAVAAALGAHATGGVVEGSGVIGGSYRPSVVASVPPPFAVAQGAPGASGELPHAALAAARATNAAAAASAAALTRLVETTLPFGPGGAATSARASSSRSRSRSKPRGGGSSSSAEEGTWAGLRPSTATVAAPGDATGAAAVADPAVRSRLRQRGALLSDHPVLYRSTRSSGYGGAGRAASSGRGEGKGTFISPDPVNVAAWTGGAPGGATALSSLAGADARAYAALLQDLEMLQSGLAPPPLDAVAAAAVAAATAAPASVPAPAPVTPPQAPASASVASSSSPRTPLMSGGARRVPRAESEAALATGTSSLSQSLGAAAAAAAPASAAGGPGSVSSSALLQAASPSSASYVTSSSSSSPASVAASTPSHGAASNGGSSSSGVSGSTRTVPGAASSEAGAAAAAPNVPPLASSGIPLAGSSAALRDLLESTQRRLARLDAEVARTATRFSGSSEAQ